MNTNDLMGAKGVTGEEREPVSDAVDEVRTEATRLVGSLESAAQALKEPGRLPGGDLIEAIRELRSSFQSAWAQLERVAEEVGIALDSPGSEPSLGNLDKAAEAVAEALATRVAADLRAAAHGVVRRVVALRTPGEGESLLEEVIAEAERVSRQLEAPDSGDISRMLVDGQHPLAALLQLVESGHALSDEQWDLARAQVAETFTPELATAAARGRIELESANGSIETRERDQSAPELHESAGKVAPISPEETAVRPQSSLDDARPDDEGAPPVAELDEAGVATATAPVPGPGATQDQPSDRFEAGPPLPAVDEAGDSATAQPPSIEENTAQLAKRALTAEGSDRVQLAEGLVWKLIIDDQLGLARGLERTLPSESEPSRRRLPHWLLSAVVLGQEIRESAGPIAQRLEMGFLEFGDDCFLSGKDDWNDIVRVLMVAAALQPAILAPSTGAPALLHGLRLDESELHELKMFCELVAEFGDRGHPLDPNCIKDVTAQVDWNGRLRELRAEAQEWRKTASLYTMVYAPATQVWKRWLEPGGQLVELLEPVVAHTPESADWLRSQCDLWHKEADIDRAVQRTFAAMKGRKRGLRIEAKALRQIVSHVGEVIEIARKWLSLLDTRPDRISDYVRKQAQGLRAEVMGRREGVVAEIGKWQQERDQLARAAAAQCLKSSLDSLYALLEPSSEFSFEEPEPHFLLSGDLLRTTCLLLDESWEPSRSNESFEEMLRGLAEPTESWSKAFYSRIENLDLEGSARIIDLLMARAASEATLEELQEKQQRAEREAREAFGRDLQETRGSVERALASGLLRETERNDLAARIEATQARMAEGQNYLAARSDLEGVRARLDETRIRELSETRQRLEALDLPPEDAARIRIEEALDRSDAWTAHEYLDRVERGTALPQDQATRRAFAEFWPHGALKIADALQQRKVKGLRQAIGTKAEFGGLRFDSLETREQDRARELAKAWTSVGKARLQVEPVQFRALFHELGFEGPKVDKIDNGKHHTWVQIQTEPVAERRLIPVAHFGSQSGGRFRALCVWDEPSDEDLVRRVGDTAHGAPVIVFYFGVLSEAKRRSLARLCLDQHRSFVVVDDVLMAFLAAERGSRLPVLFACSLPFTWLEPFATTAGLVPPEMFYGRREERAEIENRQGSCFIYGGRQLGKTALLRDVEGKFNDPDAGRVARYVDLKREGIGYDRSASDLWGLVARELKCADVIPTSIREQSRHERIGEAIIAWLNAEPGRRILLLLDEADEFLAADGRAGWRCSTHLKGLMDETNRQFKVVFAGLHNVQRSVRSANHPLAHYGHAICIGPLIESGEWSDARELIQGPLEVMGFEFESQDLITRILSQTNYFPSLLQLYGQQLLRKLADPRSLAFDDLRSPPSIVTEAVVDDAYQGTRGSIRQRMQWTLQLDPRYEVLAYALALESMSSSEGSMKGNPVEWFRNEALLWWSAGFSGERGSYDAVHAILDEMVGLGVFRQTGSGRYAFRSPNVVSLLGIQLEIEKQLEREREDPVEYAPSRFRRPDPSNPSRRSPLTVEQEETLRSERNGVSVVFGWELAGLPDLPEFLLSRFSVEAFSQLSAQADLPEFQKHFESVERKKSQGTHLIFVPDNCGWTEEWVRLAVKRCATLRSRDRHIRVLFAAGSARVWDLVGTDAIGRPVDIGDEVELLSLRPWSDDALRQWLEDVGIPIGPEDRKTMASASGGWPACLYAMGDLLRRGVELSAAVTLVTKKSIDLAKSSDVLAEPSAQRAVLKAFAEWEDALGPDELEALIDQENRDLAARVIRWGELLRLISSDAEGAWRLDPVVARAITAPE